LSYDPACGASYQQGVGGRKNSSRR